MSVLYDDALFEAFNRGAHTYDRFVAVHPGYHRQLRRSARRLGLPDGGRGLRLLDLGCGTGASTSALLGAAPHARITGVDASPGMLARATAKRWPPHVEFRRAPVEKLAEYGVTGRYDAAFAAYLFRNVTDPDELLVRIRELLVPGGRLAVHDYALSGRTIDRAVWTAVCRSVVIPLGRLSGDAHLYRHLWRSVLQFDTAPALGARLRKAGFRDVRVLPMPGWQSGIGHTVVGRAPRESDPT